MDAPGGGPAQTWVTASAGGIKRVFGEVERDALALQLALPLGGAFGARLLYGDLPREEMRLARVTLDGDARWIGGALGVAVLVSGRSRDVFPVGRLRLGPRSVHLLVTAMDSAVVPDPRDIVFVGVGAELDEGRIRGALGFSPIAFDNFRETVRLEVLVRFGSVGVGLRGEVEVDTFSDERDWLFGGCVQVALPQWTPPR